MQKTGITSSLLKKRYLLLFLAIVIVAGCKKHNTFTIDGFQKDNTRDYVYIKRIDVDTPVLIDSSKINRKGKFRFRIKASEPDYYQVGYSDTDFVTLLAEPGEKIKLTLVSDRIYNNYLVSGSKGSELVRMLDLKLIKTKNSLDSLSSIYTKASEEPGFEIKGPLLEQEYNKIIKEQRKYNIEFVITNINSLASIKALYQKINDQVYVLYNQNDLQYLKIVSDSLKRHYPESKHTKALLSNFEKEMNQIYARQFEQLTNRIPETKLDPDLKDINGKRIALSSLRGKYVLLTFWSTESRECITENLQLKEFYKIYKRNGFEIYQVNLDKDESAWKAAVRFDELPWISTREDDPEDPKNAILFNVKTLPTNYLFDQNGTIIASNLHGKNLQLKLTQLFNN